MPGAATPLLKTKLHKPQLTGDLVVRDRLLERMRRGLDVPLTVVSAPAGYGKSTLVSHWAEEAELPLAWLSLDEEESDLDTFVRYLLAAIHSVQPDMCEETLAMVNSPTPIDVSILGRILINELDAAATPLVIVIDDYHRLKLESEVHRFLELLLENWVPAVHLVLVSRKDPPFLLASMRARGTVRELRLRDLRFSESECADYLGKSLGLKISAGALQDLEQKTEGWVVALRLLSMYLESIDDPDSYLQGLQGGTNLTREYFLLEVLSRLPTQLVDCLLKTSVLNRFNASLCAEICSAGPGETQVPGGGRKFIDALLASNLFVISLDAEGEWFRYHHLFQEMLYEQLQARFDKEEIESLQLRASQWFAAHGFVADAIKHALAGGDADLAVRITEEHRTAEFDADRWYIVRKWLDRLPRARVEASANLLLAEAYILYEQFLLDAIPPILEALPPLLENCDERETLLGEATFFEGALNYWAGNSSESREKILESKKSMGGRRGLIGGLLGLYDGLVDCMSGNTSRALETINMRIKESKSLDGMYFSRLFAGLYFVRHLSGDLVNAEQEGRMLETVARKSNLAYTGAWGRYTQACSLLHRNRLVDAIGHFQAAVRDRYILHARAALDAINGLALAQQLSGSDDEASATLDLLDDFAQRLGDPHALTIARSGRARISLLQGDVGDAMEWARSYIEPMPTQELFIWLENPWITRARVLVAEGSEESLVSALDSLTAIRAETERCHFINQSIEVMALQALALQGLQRDQESTGVSQDVLQLSAPGMWVRPFVEAGPDMRAMITALPSEGLDVEFIARILSHGDAVPQHVPRPNPLVMLTNREQQVLELLAQHLRYKEIATRLCISPQTVNSHLKNVYQKLDVSERQSAVARAVEIGLISPR